MPKAIIIGAASGMGQQTARLLSKKGYELALADKHYDMVTELAKEFVNCPLVRKIDVACHLEARDELNAMIHDLGGLDIFIYCAGIKDKSGLWENEYNLHQVNAVGFAALASMVFNYYKSNHQKGQIVGISSLLAMRGFCFAIPYCASKAFMRGYMQGLRHESSRKHLGITITDIRPGFVDTNMLKNQKGLFWVSPVRKAAEQIVEAIYKKKKWAYITKRWEFIGLISKYMPDALLHSLKIRNY